MNNGASTMPRKMLAAVERPTAPPTPSVRSKQPRHAAHDRRQDAPVEQERRQHAHDQHDRQRLEREDEIGAGRLEVERQRAAAEIAEHEGAAGARGGRDGADGVIDGAEGRCDQRHLDQHQRGEDGDDEADRRLPERHCAAVLAKRPGDRQKRHHAERRLQLQHYPEDPALSEYGSGARASAMPATMLSPLTRRPVSATGRSCLR